MPSIISNASLDWTTLTCARFESFMMKVAHDHSRGKSPQRAAICDMKALAAIRTSSRVRLFTNWPQTGGSPSAGGVNGGHCCIGTCSGDTMRFVTRGLISEGVIIMRNKTLRSNDPGVCVRSATAWSAASHQSLGVQTLTLLPGITSVDMGKASGGHRKKLYGTL